MPVPCGSRWLFEGNADFPPGSFHMKNVRTNPFESESYEDFRKLANGSGSATVEQKYKQLLTLVDHFPLRQFLLIGDSGERDPEIFQRIREARAQQIKEIRIRDVVNARQYAPERLDGMSIIEPGTSCQEISRRERCAVAHLTIVGLHYSRTTFFGSDLFAQWGWGSHVWASG